ncbi:MAG: MmgE/PrpD family protein [Dongiaceae bacterium]
MPSLTQQLVRLIRARPITDDDRDCAVRFLLDTVANALGARNTAPGRMLRGWFAQQGGDAGRQAFLIGGLSHILEMDDLHRASVTHPGCVVVPAALALALRKRCSGPALLDAIIRGYEAVARIGMAAGPAHYRIWHSTATCGPFGAGMAAAELLGLDDGQAVHALGNAGTQASGLWQFIETGAMSKHLHAGRAAEAGVTAAELAALGFTGPPAILEGAKGLFAGACPDADPDAVTRDPSAPWQLRATSIKPWPCCRHTHPAIDAAIELHGRLGGVEPRTIEVSTYGAALEVCNRPAPANEYAAKFSLQHCVALALTDGRVGFLSFDEAARGRLAPLSGRVALRAAEPFICAYPGHWGAEIALKLPDGRELTASRKACKGDPDQPLGDTEMNAKAELLLAHGGIEGPKARRIVGGLLGLAGDGTGSALASVLEEGIWPSLR